MARESIFLVFLMVLSVLSKTIDIDNTKDIVWFPDPNVQGGVIPAILTQPDDFKLGDVSDVHLYLFTKDNVQDPDEIFVGDVSSVSASHIKKGNPLKIMVHGFGSSIRGSFPGGMKTDLLREESSEDLNIILVDWEVLAASPDYFTAVANAQITSQLCADLIEFLIDEQLVNREDIHLIGYSLGGQVVGQIGARVKDKLTRITALDPAMPLFDVADLFNRTDESDAVFVDVIHTAANGIIGFPDPCGHADFFVNGGSYQPGCGIDISGGCSHGRAPAYFMESVDSETGFAAKTCSSYEAYLDGTCDENASVMMGYNLPPTTRGIYYLKTNSTSPFALG